MLWSCDCTTCPGRPAAMHPSPGRDCANHGPAAAPPLCDAIPAWIPERRQVLSETRRPLTWSRINLVGSCDAAGDCRLCRYLDVHFSAASQMDLFRYGKNLLTWTALPVAQSCCTPTLHNRPKSVSLIIRYPVWTQ